MVLLPQLKTIAALNSPPSIHRAAVESHLLSAIEASACLLHVKESHSRFLRLGFFDSCFLFAKLLRRLAAVEVTSESYPRLIFTQVPRPNSFLWTSLIRCYTLHGRLRQASLLYTSMRRHGLRPLSFTFSALLEACGAAKDLAVGAQFHAQTIPIGGFSTDLFVHNTLLRMYVDCDEINLARKLFDEMPMKDVISWTSLITAYSKISDMDEAAKLFEISSGKDKVAWTAMISGFSQNARPRDSLKFFHMMKERGVEIDDVTLVSVISACAQLGAIAEAKRISEDLHRRGAHGNLVVGSALVDMFGKCGLIDDAQKIFESMPEKNVFSYSAMIAGLAANGRANYALKLFEEMANKTSVTPNDVTFIGVLTACSHGGLVDEGRHYFRMMQEKYDILPTIDHYACMVDLLGRAGLVEEARALVDDMPMAPRGGVWGALLGACRIHGNPDVAEEAAGALFELEPGAIGNYVVLCNVYAQAGMWEKVSKVRKLMRERGLRKNPGCSSVETKDGATHEFFAGHVSHPRSKEIKALLDELTEKLKSSGYFPNLCSVHYDVSDEEKERILMGHSEKMALAFGILTSEIGETIRIVKNLRVCEDCHLFMCLVSSVLVRKIVIRDNLRFHHFEAGSCSCGGFW